MAENKVRFLRGTAAEYADAVKDEDTFYYTTDDEKLYIGEKEINSQVCYATCDTVKNEAVKIVNCDRFKFIEGSVIVIKFTAGNTGDNPSGSNPIILKINDDNGRTIAYNRFFGEGILCIIDVSKGDMFCGNQTWIFSYIGNRFVCLNYSQAYNTFVGATPISQGVSGMVPVSAPEDVDKFLKGDGTWGVVTGGDIGVATTDTDGLMSASDKTKLDGADNKYALKFKYGDTTIDVGRKAGSDIGDHSTAEGYYTTASGHSSHAEGSNTIASGKRSHAECDGTTASGNYSHAEGFSTIASGSDAHAEGSCTIASGNYSHARGNHTKALHDNETASGKYNESNEDTLFSIGDGTADDARHNAFEITTTGGKLHDKDIATTDLIPTELPANGGNADTIDGKHASDFIYARGYFDNIDLDDIKYPCSGLALDNCTHSPNNYWGTLLVYTGGTGSFTQIYISTEDDGAPPTTMYFRHHGNTRWSDWKEISTTPIKSTTFSANADENGNFSLWASGENKVPISIQLDNKTFYAVPFLYNNQVWLGNTINEVTRQPVANVTVSGTIFYLEL